MTAIRFAPSLNGSIHIGNLRSIIYSQLFARKKGLELHLRVDDTDIAKNNIKYLEEFTSLCCIMSIPFCKTYHQMDLLKEINEIAKKLLEKGLAYYCGCDQHGSGCCCKKVGLQNGYLVLDVEKCIEIFFDKKRIIEIYDLAFGSIKESVDCDIVLLRKDDTPLYNFASVCCDYITNVSYIVRGADHINNSVKQKIIWYAICHCLKQREFPTLIHLPLVFDSDGKKLSKSSNETYCIMDLLKKGFLKETLLNASIKLGWGYKDWDIFSLEEFFDVFELSQLKKGNVKIQKHKIESLNKKYILSHYKNNTLFSCIWKYIFLCGIKDISAEEINRVLIEEVVSRCTLMSDIVDYIMQLKQEYIICLRIPKYEEAIKKAMYWMSCDSIEKISADIKSKKGLDGILRLVLFGNISGLPANTILKICSLEIIHKRCKAFCEK